METNELLRLAVEKGLDAAALNVLCGQINLQTADEAARAFDAAMVEFQAEVPPIGKSRTVKTEKYSYGYAELDHIVQTVRPILAKHGLYAFFDVTHEGESVRCRCIVRHKLGGERASEFSAPIDSTAKMNDTQKVGSAQSYARRYAYIAVLGLTIAGDDDDAQSASGSKEPRVTPEQAAVLETLSDVVQADAAKFLAILKAATFADIPAKEYDRAVRMLESKRAK